MKNNPTKVFSTPDVHACIVATQVLEPRLFDGKQATRNHRSSANYQIYFGGK